MAASDAKGQWIERVLGVVLPDAAADNGLAQIYDELLATVTPDLRQLAAADPQAASPIAARIEQAKADAAAGRFENAVGTLTEVTDALAAALGAVRRGAAKAAIPEGTVARMRDLLAQSASRWDRAREVAQAGARSFQTALRDRYPAEAAGFEAILDSYWLDLSQAIAAGGGAREPDTGQVLQTAQALRAEMQSDPLFSYLEQGGIAVRPTLVAALDEVETLLAA